MEHLTEDEFHITYHKHITNTFSDERSAKQRTNSLHTTINVLVENLHIRGMEHTRKHRLNIEHCDVGFQCNAYQYFYYNIYNKSIVFVAWIYSI